MAYTKLLRFRHIIISNGNPIIKISCNSFSKNKEIYCCSMPGEVIIDLLSLTVFKNFHFYFIAPAIIGILSFNILSTFITVCQGRIPFYIFNRII
jgi:hypothetical protein